MKKKVLIAFIVLFFSFTNIPSFAQALYSRQSGLWEDINTWTTSVTHTGAVAGSFPNTTSNVFIAPGHTITVNNLTTFGSSITFDGAGGGILVVSGSSVLTLTNVSACLIGPGTINHNGGQIIVKGNSTGFTGTYSAATTDCSSEFIYNGTANQTIFSANYDKLTLGGSGIKTFSSGIASPTFSCLNTTAATVNTDLGVIANLIVDKSVDLAGTFKFPTTISTVVFNGTGGAQLKLNNSIVDMSTSNLSHSWTINNTSISVTAGVPTLTTGTGATTVNYGASTGPQSILPYTYENLMLSGAGSTKTLSSNVVIKGFLLLGTGTTLNGLGNNIDLYGNWTYGGTYTFSPSANVNFLGNSAANISGNGTASFPNLFIKKSNASVGTDLKISALTTTISNGARLDLKAVPAHSLGSLTGGGTIAITAASGTADFPTFSGTSFVDPSSNSGSTFEYYGTSPYNLPIQASYNKLICRGASAKTLTSATTIDSLAIESGTMLQYADMTIKGNIFNNGIVSASASAQCIINSDVDVSLSGSGNSDFGILYINPTLASKKFIHASTGAVSVNTSLKFGTNFPAMFDLTGGKSVTLNNACSVIQGNIGSYIRLDYGTSSIVKKGIANADFVRSYPLTGGTSGFNNSLDITSITGIYGAAPTMTIQLNNDGSCSNCVKSFPVITQAQMTLVTGFVFRYYFNSVSEISASPSMLKLGAAQISAPQSAVNYYGPSATSLITSIDGGWRFLGAAPTITSVEKAGGGSAILSGCLGQTIRLIGTNFEPTGMSVIINGGTPVTSYSFVSPTAVEFSIPLATPLAGLGIAITNSGGTSTPYSFPVLTNVSLPSALPSSVLLCEGSTLTLAAGAINGGTLTYQWKKGGLNTPITTATLNIAATVADAGVYTVDVFSLACLTTVTSTSSVVTIKQRPSSADAYITSTLNNINQCQNGTFTMNANVPIVGTGVWSCISGCAGVSISNPSSPTTLVTGVPEQVFPVLVWTISNAPCADSTSTVSLLNYSMPTTSAIAPLDSAICISSPTITISGNTPSGTFTNVQWNVFGGPGGSTLSNAATSTPTFTAVTPGIYDISYAIRNGNCNSIDNMQVTVFAAPIINAGIDKTICYPSTSSLSGSASNASSLLWSIVSGGAGNLSSVSSVSTIYTPAGIDSLGAVVTIVLSGSNPGCLNSAGDTMKLTIHALPTAKITGGSTAICNGGSASIPITLTGTAPFTGLGLFNGVASTNLGTIGVNSYTATVSPVISRNYTLVPISTFKDNNNCVGTWSGSFFVTVNLPPTISASVFPDTICSGNNALVTLVPVGGGGGPYSVYYNTGGSNTSTVISGSSGFSVSPSTTTLYTIDSIATSTCGKLKVTGVNTTLVVNAPPTVNASMTITASDDTLCSGENTVITIANIQPSTVYKIVKKFSNINLDSIIVGSTAPSNVTVTIPYASFTHGTSDTLRFFARRNGCPVTPSLQKAIIWSSNVVPPSISVNTALLACNKKELSAATAAPIGVGYQWYQGGNQLVGKNGIKDTAFTDGVYTLKAKDDLKCSATSNAITVDYTSDKPTVLVVDQSAMVTKLTSLVVAQKYNWYAATTSGLKRIEGDTSANISVYFDGYYSLGVVRNGCFFMSNPYLVSNRLGGSLLKQDLIETDSTLIMPKLDFSTNLKVYPNPVLNSEITIDYIAGDVTSVSFMLYNAQGTMVAHKEVEANGVLSTNLNTKGLPPGIYTLYCNDGVKQLKKNILIF